MKGIQTARLELHKRYTKDARSDKDTAGINEAQQALSKMGYHNGQTALLKAIGSKKEHLNRFMFNPGFTPFEYAVLTGGQIEGQDALFYLCSQYISNPNNGNYYLPSNLTRISPATDEIPMVTPDQYAINHKMVDIKLLKLFYEQYRQGKYPLENFTKMANALDPKKLKEIEKNDQDFFKILIPYIGTHHKAETAKGPSFLKQQTNEDIRKKNNIGLTPEEIAVATPGSKINGINPIVALYMKSLEEGAKPESYLLPDKIGVDKPIAEQNFKMVAPDDYAIANKAHIDAELILYFFMQYQTGNYSKAKFMQMLFIAIEQDTKITIKGKGGARDIQLRILEDDAFFAGLVRQSPEILIELQNKYDVSNEYDKYVIKGVDPLVHAVLENLTTADGTRIERHLNERCYKVNGFDDIYQFLASRGTMIKGIPAIQHAIDNQIKLGGIWTGSERIGAIDPIIFFQRKYEAEKEDPEAYMVGKLTPFQYAVHENKPIKGMNPVLWLLNNNKKINNVSVIDYILNANPEIKWEGISVFEHILAKGDKDERLSAAIYLQKLYNRTGNKKLLVNGMEPIDFMLCNLERKEDILSALARIEKDGIFFNGSNFIEKVLSMNPKDHTLLGKVNSLLNQIELQPEQIKKLQEFTFPLSDGVEIFSWMEKNDQTLRLDSLNLTPTEWAFANFDKYQFIPEDMSAYVTKMQKSFDNATLVPASSLRKNEDIQAISVKRDALLLDAAEEVIGNLHRFEPQKKVKLEAVKQFEKLDEAQARLDSFGAYLDRRLDELNAQKPKSPSKSGVGSIFASSPSGKLTEDLTTKITTLDKAILEFNKTLKLEQQLQQVLLERDDRKIREILKAFKDHPALKGVNIDTIGFDEALALAVKLVLAKRNDMIEKMDAISSINLDNVEFESQKDKDDFIKKFGELLSKLNRQFEYINSVTTGEKDGLENLKLDINNDFRSLSGRNVSEEIKIRKYQLSKLHPDDPRAKIIKAIITQLYIDQSLLEKFDYSQLTDDEKAVYNLKLQLSDLSSQKYRIELKILSITGSSPEKDALNKELDAIDRQIAAANKAILQFPEESRKRFDMPEIGKRAGKALTTLEVEAVTEQLVASMDLSKNDENRARADTIDALSEKLEGLVEVELQDKRAGKHAMENSLVKGMEPYKYALNEYLANGAVIHIDGTHPLIYALTNNKISVSEFASYLDVIPEKLMSGDKGEIELFARGVSKVLSEIEGSVKGNEAAVKKALKEKLPEGTVEGIFKKVHEFEKASAKADEPARKSLLERMRDTLTKDKGKDKVHSKVD